MLLPALLGLTLELSAFACAMYGWHPRQPLPERLPATFSGRNGGHLTANVVSLPANQHPVLAALANVGKPVSNGELARLMGVCDGEATKRRKEVERHLSVQRQGRHVMVALA